MSPFELHEARQDAVDAEHLGGAAIDAGQHRLRQVLVGLVAVVILDELGDGAILLRRAGTAEPLERHPGFGASAQQRRPQHRKDLRRRQELNAVRQGDQPSAAQDVGLAKLVVGADDLVAEAARMSRAPRASGR